MYYNAIRNPYVSDTIEKHFHMQQRLKIKRNFP